MIGGAIALAAGVLAFVLGARADEGPRLGLFTCGAFELALGMAAIAEALQ